MDDRQTNAFLLLKCSCAE